MHGIPSLVPWTNAAGVARRRGPALLGLSGHLTNPLVSLLSLQSSIVSFSPLNSFPLSLSLILPLMMMPKVVIENLGKIVRFLLLCTVFSIMKLQIVFIVNLHLNIFVKVLFMNRGGPQVPNMTKLKIRNPPISFYFH